MDMHSGGDQKLDWPYILIEAPENEARSVFFSRFGQSPDRVTCTCCGKDYSVSESESLEQAMASFLSWRWDKPSKRYVPEPGRGKFYTLEQGLQQTTRFNVIYADEIQPEERRADVPEEGYVWR